MYYGFVLKIVSILKYFLVHQDISISWKKSVFWSSKIWPFKQSFNGEKVPWHQFQCVCGSSHTNKEFLNNSTHFFNVIYQEIESESTGKELNFKFQLQAQIVTCASDQPATNWRFQWAPPTQDASVAICASDLPAINQPSPRVWLISENGSQNSGKPIYSPDYWFITKAPKGYKSTARRSFCLCWTWGRVRWHVETFWCPSMETLQKRVSCTFLGFVEPSLHSHDWLSHWSLAVDSSPQSTSLLWGQ